MHRLVMHTATHRTFTYRRNVRRRIKGTDIEYDATKDKPFCLPSGEFKPKQSLGQNFLSDQNYVMKIVDSFKDPGEGDSKGGVRVVEIGPGAGALTRVLYTRYPKMTAVELDQRSVAFLGQKLPGLNMIHKNVLDVDWSEMALERGGKLGIVANLPYYIVSQVLFSLVDSYKAIDGAVVTMQLEVAERVTAKPRTKAYGIPSVVFQLYSTPKVNFKIPPTVFYPQPKVDSALVTLDFNCAHPDLFKVDGNHLRSILSASFKQRRKMLRQSLKGLMENHGLPSSALPQKWASARPEELLPEQFLELTEQLFGSLSLSYTADAESHDIYKSEKIWRTLAETAVKDLDENEL